LFLYSIEERVNEKTGMYKEKVEKQSNRPKTCFLEDIVVFAMLAHAEITYTQVYRFVHYAGAH